MPCWNCLLEIKLKEMDSPLYSTLMRTHLEYHIQLWGHQHKKAGDLLEQVKRCWNLCCYSFLCPTCHRFFLSLPCLFLSSLALVPACLSLEFCSRCPSQDILLPSLPRLPEVAKGSSQWAKRTGFCKALQRLPQGSRRTSEPNHAWLLQLRERTAEQIACIMDFIL